MTDDGYSWGEVEGLGAEESIQLCEAVVVPVNDIKRLEEARVQLCGMIDKGNPLTGQIHFGITDIMWEITHRKYKPEGSSQSGGTGYYTPFKSPFKYDKMGNYICDNDGNMVFDMRGWGYLTGTGGLNCSPEKATKIQDRIGERVAKLMSEDAGA
jgi:hypothetical protein